MDKECLWENSKNEEGFVIRQSTPVEVDDDHDDDANFKFF